MLSWDCFLTKFLQLTNTGIATLWISSNVSLLNDNVYRFFALKSLHAWPICMGRILPVKKFRSLTKKKRLIHGKTPSDSTILKGKFGLWWRLDYRNSGARIETATFVKCSRAAVIKEFKDWIVRQKHWISVCNLWSWAATECSGGIVNLQICKQQMLHHAIITVLHHATQCWTTQWEQCCTTQSSRIVQESISTTGWTEKKPILYRKYICSVKI